MMWLCRMRCRRPNVIIHKPPASRRDGPAWPSLGEQARVVTRARAGRMRCRDVRPARLWRIGRATYQI